jgi:hypothetical protein
MCTVTFIPVKDTFFITSNRDEKASRAQALPPMPYQLNDAVALFPKDAHAGGTWIAMNENGNAAVLLNGAFLKHTVQPTYRKSRGIIFLELIAAPSPSGHFSTINLEGIEPFTFISFENNRLLECRWDAVKKHSLQLSSGKPHIWSSATLYEEAVVKKREQWFAEFLHKKPLPSQDDILHFHQFTGDGDTHNDLKMDRSGQMLTVSVTGIAIGENSGTMRYADLKENKNYQQKIIFTNSFTEA